MTLTLTRDQAEVAMSALAGKDRFYAAVRKIQAAYQEQADLVRIECEAEGAVIVGREVGGVVGEWIVTQAEAVISTRDLR